MKVKFANGVVKECAAPTEQKAFKAGIGVGWILLLRLIGETTSTELDNLLTEDNISPLEFITETEDGKDKTIFTLSGYNKVTSSTIRYAEGENTVSEIQLTKGM